MVMMSHDLRRGPSWGCTVLTQVALFTALCAAFYVGIYFQRFNYANEGARDLYFISVLGGNRPLNQQTHLLKQMGRMAKIHKVKTVVSISDLGERDPLFLNGSLNFPSLKVPWYATKTLKAEAGNFQKQLQLPNGQILDIIAVDTGPLHDSVQLDQLTDGGKDQINWLMRTLEVTDSRWHIVVGYHPVVACEGQKKEDGRTALESLHQIFLEYGVNAYFSKVGCSGFYTSKDGISILGHPGPETHEAIHSMFNTEMHDGFLLHRVSALEIVSYFINSAGKVVLKSTLHQRGKAVI
ncbi:hypothetical protein H6P81_000788 [Aristolochia fimbriata]|uniref:Calcineurin-like phosphoesterase domain-containing protein n=1 Tax=Aristolochia fimbriata TaxID=158543 RepID=A0AAV7F7Q3_ARIFI|nr:hypothetical protein H6P81_000788 [Aristolochia fimbriata]